MKRLLHLHIGAAIAAAVAIGGAAAGIINGSWILLLIAALCAVICFQLEGIAFVRAMTFRLDALHRPLSADYAASAPVNDSGGGL